MGVENSGENKEPTFIVKKDLPKIKMKNGLLGTKVTCINGEDVQEG